MIRTITAINQDGSLDVVLSADELEIESHLSPDQLFLAGSHDAMMHYADLADPDNPVRMDKTPVPYTVDGNLITLPGDELQVEVTGPITDRFTVPAGETELTFTADVPGQYTLSLRGVKYLPTEVSVAI